MLTPESQGLLAQMMMTLGHTEIRMEASRRAWARQPGFNPLAMFRHLDHFSTGYITLEDLSHYLSDHQIKVPLPEQLFLFNWFDSNGDGKATYDDFIKRMRPSDYPLDSDSTPSTYTPDTEFDFLSVILRELECIKSVLKLAADFSQKPDYSLSRAFFAVSKGKKDIGGIVLARFIEQTLNQHPSNGLLHAIIDRLDLDEDGRISQKDLSIFLQRITHILAENDVKNSSPLRMLRVKSTANSAFPSVESLENHTEPIVSTNFIIEAFKKIIFMQKNLEISRQRLATDHEISLFSLFFSFDSQKTGFLTISDFQSALNRLEIRANKGNLCLLMRHYDSDRDGYVTKEDFCRMILTNSPEYNELYCVEGRKNLQIEEISSKTRQNIREIFTNLLDFEAVFEQIRGNLHEKGANLRELFAAMDTDQSNYVTLNDLKLYLGGYGVFPALFELVAVVELLDGNRDGRVDCAEFMEILSPKAVSGQEEAT